ncbi:MAG: amidohydrolase family protein [Pseudomonadales bacterium]
MNRAKRMFSSYRFHCFVLLSAIALSGCMSKEADSPIAVSKAELGEQTILIQDVSVFNSDTLELRPNQDVLVQDTTIAAVAPTGSLSKQQNAHIIDGQGATLVPGLIDMHGHVSTTTGPSWKIALPNPEDNLRAYVYAGITTVFDPGDSSEDAFSRRDKIASGELIGPRVVSAGKIVTHDKGHPRAMVENLAPWWIRWYLKDTVATGITSPDEGIAAVNERADAGADMIKVAVDSIPLDASIMDAPTLQAVVQQAEKRGLRTVAHIGTLADALKAAESGVDLWIHGVYKERIPDDAIAKLLSFNIPMVTTSEVFDRYGRAFDGPMIPSALEKEMIAPEKIASLYPAPDDFDLGALKSWQELMQKTQATRRDNVKRLHQAGMTILAGSDTQSGVFPGAGLHRELATLVASGLSPAQAIRAATLDSALFLAADDDASEPGSGIIAKGKRADLVLVNGDPTIDISALSDIRSVILNGRLIKRVSLNGGR